MEELSEAASRLPAFLHTPDLQALTTKLLPILNKPWPDSRYEALLASSRSSTLSLRSPYLPLFQQDQLVSCQNCKRTLVVDCFQEHKTLCDSLDISELLAQEEAVNSSHNRSRSKSPQRMGVDFTSGHTSQYVSQKKLRQSGSATLGVRGGSHQKIHQTAKAGQQATTDSETELRRQMFMRGELTMDDVCGVRNGQKDSG
ncbi:MAG: hypothetical protein SGPRY_014518 [Prymnesium sp.]